jgi:hypothetical protein
MMNKGRPIPRIAANTRDGDVHSPGLELHSAKANAEKIAMIQKAQRIPVAMTLLRKFSP